MWQVGIDQRIAFGRRLIGNHIKACTAQAAVFQGGDECGFIDQAAAADVDDDTAWFQGFQFGFAQQIAGLVVEWAVQRNHVGPRQGLCKRYIAIATSAGMFVFAINHLHAKRFGALCQGRAYAAFAENQQGFAIHIVDGRAKVAEIR